MSHKQVRPASGRKRRLDPATTAGDSNALAGDRLNPRPRTRLRLFAQFPPQALFAAIHRATARAIDATTSTGGTALAFNRRRRAPGAP